MLKKLFNKNTAPMLGVFSLGLLLALPIRAYQYVKIIEPHTGFYKDSGFTVYLLYAVLALAFLLIYFLSMAKKSEIAFIFNAEKRMFVGFASLYVSVAMVLDAINMANNFNLLYYGVQSASSNEISNLTMRAGAIPMLLQAIFAIVAALFFLVLALDFFTGRNNGEKLKLLALSPLVWAIFRILHRFMRTISFLRVSDLFFELVCLVFLMLFFLAFAQLVARVNHRGTDWRMVAHGLNAALMCLLCFVPRFAMSVTGYADRLVSLSPPEQIDLALSVFILAFILNKVKFSVGKDA
ncbi:MAG: hypothetical protein GX345_00200 [Clostridiales bacterium]|nr:hypothetical protein [Clostridiales bacterium]